MFFCQSCCFSEDHPEGQPADGAALLEQAKSKQTLRSIFESSLWGACGMAVALQLRECAKRACVIAFTAPNKSTYLFSTIPTECASDLIEFAEKYIQSKTGNISHQQFPEGLKEVAITLRELRSNR
ncbi:DUF1636 domain-containing protein [Myxacorys almedinensis]|uniref:DUF1636 domain-containing protein n=1 Tax=Myxacorys almedinensis TaxID=2651157 RepID=UPI003082FDEF